MKDAKDCIRPLSLAAGVPGNLPLLRRRLGCSSFGGLQSVGTWPPFAHLWERPAGIACSRERHLRAGDAAELGLDAKAGRREEAESARRSGRIRRGAAERELGSSAVARRG